MLHSLKLFAATIALFGAGSLADQPEVVREISNDRLEGVLRQLGVTFSKGMGNGPESTYEYKVRGLPATLQSFRGKELKIEIQMPASDWKTINDWNGKSKYTKARQVKDASAVSSRLDLSGGVTEETVRNFINNVNAEVASWQNPAATATTMEETFKKITPEQLEKILKDLKIDAKRLASKNPALASFDFTLSRNDLFLRLTSYNGDDLMIDCTYPVAPLAKINDWNSKRSYIRAVAYPGANNKPYTALEANLDCTPGVSESMIHYFIKAFDTEAIKFDEYLKAPK